MFKRLEVERFCLATQNTDCMWNTLSARLSSLAGGGNNTEASTSFDLSPDQSVTRRNRITFNNTRDADVERRVSLAARNLSDSVQTIVTAVQSGSEEDSKNPDEWKVSLLNFIERSNADADNDSVAISDLDVLINYMGSEKFVLRCIEQELPPNVIHCLRLMRIFELRYAHSIEECEPEDILQPITKSVTAKVSRLACELCTDPITGEQLRPHLFRLLALPGAPYPRNGLHIASAASSIILSYSNHCLSNSLVWFLHDRKMIVHMTEDIKELCGMTSESYTSGSKCLYGTDADQAGLWVLSLQTIVHLVTNSCNYECQELIKDFDSAGGYHILSYAIYNSSTGNMKKKLLELVPTLVCCKTGPSTSNECISPTPSDETYKLATNSHAIEIIVDLMVRSIPFLQAYVEEHDGLRPIFSKENLQRMAEYSVSQVKYSQPSENELDTGFNLPSELLVTTLQLYSDNSGNFNIIEPKYNILAHYLLAFPTFNDVSTKVLILKTLEYVSTALHESGTMVPLCVASEVFIALCTTMLSIVTSKEKRQIFDELLQCTTMLCETLEKLLQFGDIMSKALFSCGLLGDKLNIFLTLVVSLSDQPLNDTSETDKFNGVKRNVNGPPTKTEMDRPFSLLCRILKHVIYHDMEVGNISDISIGSPIRNNQNSGRMNLHMLLKTGIKYMGDDASMSALSVFEAMMSSKNSHDLLEDDMTSLIDILHFFPASISDFETVSPVLNSNAVYRQIEVVRMLKVIMETNEPVQDMFRAMRGFEHVIDMTLGLQNKVICTNNSSEETLEGIHNSFSLVMIVLSELFALVNASTTPPQKHRLRTYSSSTSRDLIIKSESPSILPATYAFELNQSYLSRTGFYKKFAKSIKISGILDSLHHASTVLDLAFSLIAPNFKLPSQEHVREDIIPRRLTNADATRLVLAISVHLPNKFESLSMQALDKILTLCCVDVAVTPLSQLAQCGLAISLTKQTEFGSIVMNPNHSLHSRFMMLLRRITSFHMSNVDFVALIRNIAGPILLFPNQVSKGDKGRIVLPIISSSINISGKRHLGGHINTAHKLKDRESDIRNRLETLAVIAKEEDSVSRCILGGESLDTVALYMQRVSISDRFAKLADEGKMKYIEIPSVTGSSQSTAVSGTSSTMMTTSTQDKVWPPFSSLGFSFSLWLRVPSSSKEVRDGSIFLLDLSACKGGDSSPIKSSTSTKTLQNDFLTLWFDVCTQSVCTLTSSGSRNKPVFFPSSPLHSGVWHHILITYQPPKRSLTGRKALLSLFVDGRPLKSDVKVESVNLPTTAKAYIGVPNPILAASGIIRGLLPEWELGQSIFVSGILTSKDATAMYWAGPNFKGLFWGDRPQRLSLIATATATFAMLAQNGERGSVAGALRRRQMSEVEAIGQVNNGKKSQNDNLSTAGLLCLVNKEDVIFGFSPCTHQAWDRSKDWKILTNIARINSDHVSTDARIFGHSSVINPITFAENVQWIGGPKVLLPLVNAVNSSACVALALRLIRESSKRHIPNLENLQNGGGYRIIGLLLRQKLQMDAAVMDQCFAFSVFGFEPGNIPEEAKKVRNDGISIPTWTRTEQWVLVDLHAIKYLLLNHQVWDLRRSGPDVPVRLLVFLNALVSSGNTHAAFNSRRLHLLGIVKWTLHLMLESAELYSHTLEISASNSPVTDNQSRNSAANFGWKFTSPSVMKTSAGGDPDNPVFHFCKSLLRRILTFMLTPDDLRDIAGAVIYTLSITGGIDSSTINDPESVSDHKLPPGPVACIYLVRLFEELVVDGVNEIISANASAQKEAISYSNEATQNDGGSSASNKSYLASAIGNRRKFRAQAVPDVAQNPKHQQAQAFLSAFATILTPVWFACVLEGSREEASASASLRLLILMLQSCPPFNKSFFNVGGFAPLVLSIPKFSSSPSIIMTMLAHLLHFPILKLPFVSGEIFANVLIEIFDSQNDAADLIMVDDNTGGSGGRSEPSSGIFALLAECFGRNIQLASYDNDLGTKAKEANKAVIGVLSHRHNSNSSFQEFCRTTHFLEPMAQALCLVHDEKVQKIKREDNVAWLPESSMEVEFSLNTKSLRRGNLLSVNNKETPTQRFVGGVEAIEESGMGMVELLHLVLSHSVLSGILAAPLLSALFKSFPIHASLEQVEAFHLVLIEHCSIVVKDVLQRGHPLAIANCIGISSVLLDRLMGGFFTSEPIIETVDIILSILKALTSGTYVSRTLGGSEQVMLVGDAAHLARLTILTALNKSRSKCSIDSGDDDLKFEVLKRIAANLRQLLHMPGFVTSGKRGSNNSSHLAPPIGSRMYPLYQCASFVRCSPHTEPCSMYPDLHAIDQPDRAFVVSLMSEIHYSLLDERTDIREQAVVIVVSLLQQRRGFMSELLITDIPSDDNRTETVDLINRGGFGALLVAHEAATIVQNISTVPRKPSSRRSLKNSTMSVGNLKYASFFEWLERNKGQVAAVFQGIHTQSSRLLPGLESGADSPADAIDGEQKQMLVKITSHEFSDRTVQVGHERAEKAHELYEKTTNSHTAWLRQGFNDLASGAMQWKTLLRQLKGSQSIWEGEHDDDEIHSKSSLFPEQYKDRLNDDKEVHKMAANQRWKLDLTEGYERQRRRLLPCYEFESLYNLSEENQRSQLEMSRASLSENNSTAEHVDLEGSAAKRGSIDSLGHSNVFGNQSDSVEATAALLKQMQARASTRDIHFSTKGFFEEDDERSIITNPINNDRENNDEEKSCSSCENDNVIDSRPDTKQSQNPQSITDNETASVTVSVTNTELSTDDMQIEKDEVIRTGNDNSFASSYDVITGILQPGDWPEKSYNVKRCTGLEVRQGLLLWCRDAIYVVDGFEQTDGDGLEGKINRLHLSTSSYYINLRSDDFISKDEEKTSNKVQSNVDGQDSSNGGTLRNDFKDNSDISYTANDEVQYQNHSIRISFNDLYSVYRRRYQLQQIALEFYDVNRNGTLVAFSSPSDREEVLTKILRCPLPNSIFSDYLGGTTTINYNKFMSSLRTKITNDWVQGRMTNFDFIMHLNSFAGRTYNDLTQYPVFPWILKDYFSNEIDLDNPEVYRDLSKPMGAQGEERIKQYMERFEILESNSIMSDDEPPPFHYGTHYSCAAYVLYYLMRLEPFSRLALSLQGGHFDVSDRLFHNVGSSWLSASSENLQDVRELIPEFFYLPEFLLNSNMFDFGTTQSGKSVHHVTLPPWANSDPRQFIRINRQALESDYVSKNLHNWLDLIFGYKQRGREAVKALNSFVHLTYEGQVDLDAITDPVQRDATIAQIHNFGQTPSRLERKPFPQRIVLAAIKHNNCIDFNSLPAIAVLTPPFCIVGAPHRVFLKLLATDTCRLGMAGQPDSSVGDICYTRGQLIGVGKTCLFINPSSNYYNFGGANNGVSVHVGVASLKNREVNQILSIHDGMHRSAITSAKPSINGNWLVTGCKDSTIRVWKYHKDKVHLQACLCGHREGRITCIDVSTVMGTIVSGGADGNVFVWDLRHLTFIRALENSSSGNVNASKFDSADLVSDSGAVVSVSINHKNGNILTLVGLVLSLFDINGNLLGTQDRSCFVHTNRPSCAVTTNCPEWMEEGVVAVTGHVNGDIRLWTLDYSAHALVMCHLVPEKVHSCPITVLRTPGDQQDTLLAGDKSGKLSVLKTLRLDNLTQQEQILILKEVKVGVSCETELISAANVAL